MKNPLGSYVSIQDAVAFVESDCDGQPPILVDLQRRIHNESLDSLIQGLLKIFDDMKCENNKGYNRYAKKGHQQMQTSEFRAYLAKQLGVEL